MVRAGLRPVLCDINPKTFDCDHTLLEEKLSADTLCVVAHHLFGIPSDIERARALCAPRGVFVVEDAAQAMGAEDRGHMLGTLGDVGVFSLGRGKNITCGSGGIVVTSSDEIAGIMARECRQLERPRPTELLRDLLQLVLMAVFIRPRLYWIPAAVPFLRLGQTIYPRHIRLGRLSGMKAGLLRDWRSHLVRSNRIRSETAAYFRQRLPFEVADETVRPYLRLPVLATSPMERDRIYAHSQKRGLGISVAYPTPINGIPEIGAALSGQRFPSAESVAARLLTIPTHPWLSPKGNTALTECLGSPVPAAR